MQLGKEFRNHVRFCHGIHCTGSTDQERVPGRNDTTHTTDDDDFRHDRCLKRCRHRIGCDKSCTCLRSKDRFRIQDTANSNDHQCIECNSQNYRKDHHLTNLFQWNVDLLGCLRDDVKTNEIERCDNGHADDIFYNRAGGVTDKSLPHHIGIIAIDHAGHDQQDTRTTDDHSQYRLQHSGRLCTDDIDQGDQKGYDNGHCQPGCIDIKSGYGIEITF